MRKHFGNKDIFMAILCLFLAGAVALISAAAPVTRDRLYNEKLAAAHLMSDYMGAIKGYKAELGLATAPEDLHKTGMIGTGEHTGITTTLGAIEAKRTSAAADMAALAVQLLSEAGVRPGMRVGANFSGSFPSLNLAVLAACRALSVECVYISSVGSSLYGANQPELSFPEMAARLARDGFLQSGGAAFSIGGSGDIGGDMDAQTVDAIVKRVEALGTPLFYQPDYQKNLAQRRDILKKHGEIACFVSVGGNITSMGGGESSFYLGEGLLRGRPARVTPESGLIELYSGMGVPVINLLNLKKITAAYSLPYDPKAVAEQGTSAVYYASSPSRAAAALCLLAGAVGLVIYRKGGLIWLRRFQLKSTGAS